MDLVVDFIHLYVFTDLGADPGFQVRGGALKKIAPSRGRSENFWGISCEKSRFYAQKNHIFTNFRGGCAAPEIVTRLGNKTNAMQETQITKKNALSKKNTKKFS